MRLLPTLSNLYSWAEAHEKSSNPKAATPLFRQFEAAAQAEIGKPGNADVDLIFFYLNQRDDPAKALSVATTRGAEYRDSRTLDALAWALYSSGRYSEARIQMDRALAVGVRNSFYFCHAAQISAKLNDADAVRKYRKDLTDFAPNSCPEQPITTAVRKAAQ
jgi:Tfp pilus assembly protein PilF